jgi:hypothetical protein
MDILDETVGPERWQKEYYEVKGNVYCRIGILTDNGWVWKADCGMESNVDAAKGEASDAFKRACVSWGIGRELYSGPRIKIKCPDNYYYNEHLSMTFYVHDIAYEGKAITSLTIFDKFDNLVFTWDCNIGVKTPNKPVETPKQDSSIVSKEEALTTFCKGLKGSVDNACLKAFYDYYKEKVETWNGVMDFPSLWKRHLERYRR